MTDIDRIGGIPVVMKALLDAGLLHGDALTVTGKTLAENLAELNPPALDGDVLHTLANPIHRTGGIAILHGIAGARGRRGEERRLRRRGVGGPGPGVRRREGRDGRGRRRAPSQAGDVIVIRWEGPKGGPGMREMLAVTGAIKGAGLGKDVLLLTDGRFSGGTTGPVHRARRAGGRATAGRSRWSPGRRHHPARHGGQDAGPAGGRRRSSSGARAAWMPHPQNLNVGVLGKYAKLVGSAAAGAVCF